MVAVTVICSLFAILCIILGLLLSRTGAGGGLTTLAGQDLEIFKKTKDRGILKFLQILMFVLGILLIFVVLIVHIFVK